MWGKEGSHVNHILPGAANFLLAPWKTKESRDLVYIKTYSCDLQLGGGSLGGESIPDLLQAMMKIAMQAPGLPAIACSSLESAARFLSGTRQGLSCINLSCRVGLTWWCCFWSHVLVRLSWRCKVRLVNIWIRELGGFNWETIFSCVHINKYVFSRGFLFMYNTNTFPPGEKPVLALWDMSLC